MKNFKQFNESDHYGDTSWTIEIDNKEVNITIHDIQKYLDSNDVPVIELPVSEIFDLCIHKNKTDRGTLIRSEESDLSFPIIIVKGLDDEWVRIIDGHHRLLKAHNRKIKCIKVRVLDLKNSPQEYKDLFL